MCDLTNPIFHDETKARAHLEALRWAGGRYCPHCGEAEQTSPVKGKSHRPVNSPRRLPRRSLPFFASSYRLCQEPWRIELV